MEGEDDEDVVQNIVPSILKIRNRSVMERAIDEKLTSKGLPVMYELDEDDDESEEEEEAPEATATSDASDTGTNSGSASAVMIFEEFGINYSEHLLLQRLICYVDNFSNSFLVSEMTEWMAIEDKETYKEEGTCFEVINKLIHNGALASTAGIPVLRSCALSLTPRLLQILVPLEVKNYLASLSTSEASDASKSRKTKVSFMLKFQACRTMDQMQLLKQDIMDKESIFLTTEREIEKLESQIHNYELKLSKLTVQYEVPDENSVKDINSTLTYLRGALDRCKADNAKRISDITSGLEKAKVLEANTYKSRKRLASMSTADVRWNYLLSDKILSDTVQIELQVHCEHIDLLKSKHGEKSSSSLTSLISFGKKTADILDENQIESWIVVSAYFNGRVKKLDSTFSNMEDFPSDGEGNPEEAPPLKHARKASSSPGKDARDWQEMSKTPSVKHSFDPNFPCPLLLQCEKFQNNDLIKIALMVKPTSRDSPAEFAAIELDYKDILIVSGMGMKSFDLPTTKTDLHRVPSMTVTFSRPQKYERLLSHVYHPMQQHYKLRNLSNVELDVTESLAEDSCTWQVPLKFLMMRINDLKALLESTEEDEASRNAVEEMISKYQTQVFLLENEWHNLSIPKNGPRAFKPSTTKTSNDFDAVPTNLHYQQLSVRTLNGTDVYDIVTMGCPAVHSLKFKEGGLRRQIESRFKVPGGRRVTKGGRSSIFKTPKGSLSTSKLSVTSPTPGSSSGSGSFSGSEKFNFSISSMSPTKSSGDGSAEKHGPLKSPRSNSEAPVPSHLSLKRTYSELSPRNVADRKSIEPSLDSRIESRDSESGFSDTEIISGDRSSLRTSIHIPGGNLISGVSFPVDKVASSPTSRPTSLHSLAIPPTTLSLDSDKLVSLPPVPGPISIHSSDPDVIKMGWMEKRGRIFTKMRRRFFVLNSVALEYYLNETSIKAQGLIPLDSVLIVRRSHTGKPSSSIDVVTRERVYVLNTDSYDEMISWMNCLNLAQKRGPLNTKPKSVRSGNYKQSLFARFSELSLRRKDSSDISDSDGSPSNTGSPVSSSGPALEGGGRPKTLSEADFDLINIDNQASKLVNLVTEARWRKEPVIFSGWVQKQHPRSKKMQTRFFRLHTTILRYFKNESNSHKAQGMIDMADVTAVRLVTELKTIEIETAERIFIFQPGLDNSYAQQWLFHLKKAMSEATSSLDGTGTIAPTSTAAVSVFYQIQSGEVTSAVEDEAMIYDVKLSRIRYRLDMAFSQILSALVVSFVARLEICLNSNSQQLNRMARLGFLFQLESLVSTYGNEEGMLEDIDAAMKELRNVKLSLAPLVETYHDNQESLTIHRENSLIVVTVKLPGEIYKSLPLPLRDPKLRIAVIPIMFTQGINEMQTISNKVGDTSLQEAINNENLELLTDYFKRFHAYHQSTEWKVGLGYRPTDIDCGEDLALLDSSSLNRKKRDADKMKHHRLYDISQLMTQLTDAVLNAKAGEKNFNILRLSSSLIRELNGGRVTCCKSGKDRTGMSCTLEEGRILRDKYSFSTPNDDNDPKFVELLRVLRIYGVRLANARKNTGKAVFAFNRLQRNMLPDEYRPPQITCKGIVQS